MWGQETGQETTRPPGRSIELTRRAICAESKERNTASTYKAAERELDESARASAIELTVTDTLWPRSWCQFKLLPKIFQEADAHAHVQGCKRRSGVPLGVPQCDVRVLGVGDG